jgi:hypothetical protein
LVPNSNLRLRRGVRPVCGRRSTRPRCGVVWPGIARECGCRLEDPRVEPITRTAPSPSRAGKFSVVASNG